LLVGDIFSKTIGLPVYMDITVSVAEGLVNGDEVAFEHWTEEVRKTAGRFTSTPAKMCQGLKTGFAITIQLSVQS